jgi:hypothetical protein
LRRTVSPAPPMKGEDRAAPGIGIELVEKGGLDAGTLVEEGERIVGAGESRRQPFGVAPGLGRDAGQGGADFLGLDDAGGFAVQVEQVIGEAVALFQGELADGHALRCAEIGLAPVLDGPARLG